MRYLGQLPRFHRRDSPVCVPWRSVIGLLSRLAFEGFVVLNASERLFLIARDIFFGLLRRVLVLLKLSKADSYEYLHVKRYLLPARIPLVETIEVVEMSQGLSAE